MEKPLIISVAKILEEAKPREFIVAMETESMIVACQWFHGAHKFRHINKHHDEILYVISGKLHVWTRMGEYELAEGESIKIPRNVEHGDLFGTNVRMIIIEGKL